MTDYSKILSFKLLLQILIICCSPLLLISQNLQVFVRSSHSSEYLISTQNSYKDSVAFKRLIDDQVFSDISNGFALAGIDSIVADTNVVKVFYTRGPQFLWDEINVVGFDKSAIKAKFPVKQGGAFRYDELYNWFYNVLDYYVNAGYPFANLRIDSLRFVDEKVSASVFVTAGNRFYFDSIYLKSDEGIKSYLIYKETGFKKNEEFSMQKLTKIENRLKNLNFVELSRPYELAFSDSTADLLLYLKKKRASQFNGLIGILPNNITTGKVLVTGDVNLSLLNSVGFGEYFMFRWQKFESLSQNLKTEVSAPYLFKSDFGFGLKFDLEKKDSSYLNTDFSTRIIFGSNISNGFELFFRQKKSFLLSDNAINSDTFKNYNTNLWGIAYRLVGTDNILNPSKGVYLLINASLGTRTVDINLDAMATTSFQTRNLVDISYYVPIRRFMTIKIRSLTSTIISIKLSENELDRIGGLNSVRGFDELSLPVSSFSLLNLELRYLFDRESAFFAFFDSAYLEKRNTFLDDQNLVFGTGVGLDLNTGAGTFSLVYAIGKQNDNPFLFNNSKIHFGYRNSF
jgi:outer membrane protein assembly factor BamA